MDYGPVIQWKLTLLDRAFDRFKKYGAKGLKREFENFKAAEANWLQDFALFMAIKASQNLVSWDNWPKPLRNRDPKALEKFRAEHPEDIERNIFRQWLFFRQWTRVREYANEQGIQIIGDIPIFVAYDSADAWANPELFFMDEDGVPTFVAGVPPDYFSPTGQLWGNPIYKWDMHKASGYAWWIERLRATLKLFDIVRLDHFRGFAGYWEIPAGMPTAEVGRWATGPGQDFFIATREALKELPIIAEDLGEITPDTLSAGITITTFNGSRRTVSLPATSRS